MGAALNNCIQAVNELQQIVSYFMQQNAMKIDDVKDALIDHMDTFHSMLIVKNKEDSNESNIP